ncbi:MAG: acyltransferase, partial [Lentisphaerae bacterium]|nr:acyltransferase [Lentisphaerota bacterium]
IRCRNGSIRIETGGDIGCYCILASDSHLHIGKEVLIGAYSYLCGGGRHRFDAGEVIVQRQDMEPSVGITIGDGAWLAARTSVMDGADIGKGAVVGADSLVTKPIPAMSLAYGTPARVQRERGTGEGQG